MTKNMHTFYAKKKGFTLVEIMISLTLGLVICSAVVKVMISNSISEKLNRAVASTQEAGRYIITKMRTELLMVGLYDQLSPKLNTNVDIAEEENFLRNHPIPIPGDFIQRPQLGSIQGLDGTNDTLVVSLQGRKDCRGFTLGYLAGSEIFIVNEYFVSNKALKCRGFDGRVLRGKKIAQGHNRHAAYTILDDVLSFQVSYGITGPKSNKGNAMPTKYVDAAELRAAFESNKQVVSLHLAIVIKGEGDINLGKQQTFKLLNENPITAPDNGLYKVFETTITLRNVKNFVKESS